MANQQKNIAPQIIAMTELLLEELILLCRERPQQQCSTKRRRNA